MGWHHWLPVPIDPAAPAGLARGSVEVVARFPNHLDLFLTGSDGGIYSTWWDSTAGWGPWFNLPGRQANPGQTVAAVARNPTHLDLFVTDARGIVVSTWWDAATGWGDWFDIPGDQPAAHSRVTAIARDPNHLDLFFTAEDGGVYTTWWDAATGWGSWFKVAGSFTARGPVEVVARNPDHLDLFVSGTDGGIYSTWWDAATGWGSWFNLPGVQANPGAPVTALARNPDHLDLFVVGNERGIYSTWWDVASGWGTWFSIPGRQALQGSPVTAVARTSDHLDLFITDSDGTIASTFWDGATGWGGWFTVSGGHAPPGSCVAAVARTPDHLDLFVRTMNGRIGTTRWDPTPTESASFDIGLLNLLLADATATMQLRVHLESSKDDKLSRASWSKALATVLHGQAGYDFHVDNPSGQGHRFHLTPIDSDPRYPQVTLLTDPPRLDVQLAFQTNRAQLKALDHGVPDFDLQDFGIGVSVVFDGTIYPACSARATGTIAGVFVDISQQVRDGVVKGINDRIQDPQVAAYFEWAHVVAYIDAFFIRLMRLGSKAEIAAYRTDGQTLIVDYYPSTFVGEPIDVPPIRRKKVPS